MAQYHRRLESDSAAMFSPSVARIAASNARDWSYIDNWLGSKFPGRALPEFERNPDTLKALLALASVNETADEERALMSSAENDALARFEATTSDQPTTLRDKLLDAIEEDLPQEGQVALDSLASMANQAGIAFPEAQDFGRKMIAMQQSTCAADTMRSRVQTLQRHIQNDAGHMKKLLHSLEGDDYRPHPELAKRNLEMQRTVKAMAAQLPDLRDRAASLETASTMPRPSIQDVARDEKEYLDILARKKQLDSQMAAFERLPNNPDLARAELNTLRSQLHGATSHRDEVFEGLVERESPVKRRYK